MPTRQKLLACSTIFVLVLALATSVWAQPKDDDFWVELSFDNFMEGGGGSGWAADGNPSGQMGEWIYYPDAPEGKDWWNQWFYNDLPDDTRRTEIVYGIQVRPSYVFPDLWVEVAFNWSTVDFEETGPDGPPPGPDQEQYIAREVIYSDHPTVNTYLIGDYVNEDYNPEWVSVDVRLSGPGVVSFSGDIMHECVPKPGSANGDANGDGYVDGADAMIVATNWLQTIAGGYSVGDFDLDGDVDDADATILATNWGAGTSAQVPEPSTITLLLCGLACLIWWRRKK